MFERRTQYYRGLAARLRRMADETHFGEIRTSWLKLAYQFERLAENAERRGAVGAYAAISGEDD